MSLSAQAIKHIADLLLHARATNERISFQEYTRTPLTLDDAYSIQAHVASDSGPIGAWKTGRPDNASVPVYAPILAQTVRLSPASYDAHELHSCGIELEIGFCIDRPLPPPGPDFAAALRNCVRPLVTLEMVDSRVQDFTELPAAAKLADNQVNGGLVIGTPVDDWADVNLTQAEVTLSVNGQVVISCLSDVPGGNAFDTLVALASLVGTHCGGLQPGQFVSTGTLSGILFLEPGSTVQGEVAGLGTISATYGI